MNTEGNFYKSFGTERVKGGEYDVEEESRLPFAKEIEGIPTFSVVPVELGEEQSRPPHLVEVSKIHGRDLEVKEARAIWEDKNGVLFGSLNIKGNTTRDLHVEPDRYAPSGFKVFGLFDSGVGGRHVTASKFLREHGVETEKIEQVVRPQELIIQGKRLPMTEVKKRLLDDARQTIEKGGRRQGLFDLGSQLTKEDLPEIEKYLDKTEFLFLVRSMQVTERVRDLREMKTREEFVEMMKKVFQFVNIRERVEARRSGGKPEKFDVDDEQDVERYFSSYLPRRCAANLAKLHNLGLAHGWPTDANFSLAGSIYDLDSVHGRPLISSDAEVANDDRRDDLDKFIEGIQTVFRGGVLTSVRSRWFKENIGEKMYASFVGGFFEEYLQDIDVMALGRIETDYRAFEDSIIQSSLEEMREALQKGETTVEEIREGLEKENPDQLVYEEYARQWRNFLDGLLPTVLVRYLDDEALNRHIGDFIDKRTDELAKKYMEGQPQQSSTQIRDAINKVLESFGQK